MEIYTTFFHFYFSFVGPKKEFSDIVILCKPNSCCQQNLMCFDMPLLSLGLFSWKSSND